MGKCWLVATGLALSVFWAGCSKPGEESEAKRSPIPEPAPGVKYPKNWELPITAAGKKVQTIRLAELKARSPDFRSEDRLAWRLDGLIDNTLLNDDLLVEAVGSDKVGIAMRLSKGDKAPVPVLMLTRRGEIVAAVVQADNPFPDYHGQGGRLRRPGDPLPRLLQAAVELKLRSTGAEKNDQSQGAVKLSFQIEGGVPQEISQELWNSLASSVVQGDSGDKRQSWSLREIGDALGKQQGKSLLLIAVVGQDEVSISREDWQDEKKQPVLQRNRRGLLKFTWREGGKEDKSMASTREVRQLRFTVRK